MKNRWQQIEELYHAAMEQSPEQRSEFLRLRCGTDQALQREVESLLVRDSESQGPLDHHAWDGMESLLSDIIPPDEAGDAPLPPGTAIGPYQITEVVGAGGMGRVYRAQDTRLGRMVAVKVSKARFSERFEREARAIAALNHPNICQLYDVGSNFLVMEFVEGAPVTSGYSLSKTISVAAQIAEGLAAAHDAGIAHRDLKPDNVLLTRAGQVKIVDFGLAKVAGSRVAAVSAEPGAVLSEPGAIMGTVEYMSPEQVRGQQADHRSDIFSVGLIVYEMLAGRRAFTGETLAETMTAILKQDTPELPEAVPVLMRQIVARCLEKDPANRFQSAKDLGFALQHSSHAVAATAGAATDKPARRVRTATATAVLIAIIATVTALALASRQEPLDISRFRFTPFAVDARDTFHPEWSPDGRILAYFERAEKITRIVVRDLYRATPPIPLIQVQQPGSSLSWSPDGERILYAEPGKGILSVSRAGGQPKVVFASSRGTKKTYNFPTLSPDGSTLAVMITDRTQPESVTRLAFSFPPGAEPKLVADVLFSNPSSIAWASNGDRVLVGDHSPAGDSVISVTRDGRKRRLQQILGAGPFGVDLSAIPHSRFFVTTRIAGEDAYGLALIDGELGNIHQLLPSHTPVTSASVSPSGSRVAYTSRSLHGQAYEIPITGGPPRPLSPSNLSQYGVAFSPRRNEFAFTRFGELVVHDRSASEERVLVSSEDFPGSLYRPDLLWPAFSHAGDRIIFTCVGCEKDLSLWVAPAAGGTPAKVAGNGIGGISASWSPDGAQIAYVQQSPTGHNVPVRLRLGSGEKPQPLATAPCGPSWSPTGDWILCRGRTLKLISQDGSQVREIGETYVGAGWSNDGKRIYTARRAGDRVIVEGLDPTTGKSDRLTECSLDGPCPQGSLSVSADGKSIAFTAAAGDGDIWILDGLQAPRTLWERLWPRK